MRYHRSSEYQREIYRFIEKDCGSLVIEALAGSGKTHTLIECLKRIDRRSSSIFLAFNKSIQVELEKQCPDGVHVKTIHGLGYSILRQKLGTKNLVIDKIQKIIKSNRNFSTIEKRMYGFIVEKAIHSMKLRGVAPTENHDGIIKYSDESLYEWVKGYCVNNEYSNLVSNDSILYRIVDMVKQILIESVNDHESVDFQDMVYLPMVFNLESRKYDYVFVDEAQDISEIQRRLIVGATNRNTRVIASGDRFQSIYLFMGTDIYSIDRIGEIFNSKFLPLPICYRCDRKIIDEAKKIVKGIQFYENNSEGHVNNLGKYDTNMFLPCDLVLCRNNAPVIRLAYKLISKSIPVEIIGNDISSNIISLLDKLSMGTTDLDGIRDKFVEWRIDYKSFVKENGGDIGFYEEKCDSLEVFLNFSKSRVVEELKNEIESFFNMNDDCFESNKVTLSTIHKAKGMGRDRVFFLDKHLIPTPNAKTSDEKQQEKNLMYVGVTRAKHELNYIKSVGGD